MTAKTTTTTAQAAQTMAQGERLRVNLIPERYKVLSPAAWKNLIARGVIPSTKLEGVRARVVRVADIEAFLNGTAGVTA